MKHLIRLMFTLLIVLFTSLSAFAYDFEVDGIFYNKTGSNTVEVTSGSWDYSGSVTIPGSVTNSGTTYSVTSIGERAFYKCSGLTTVTIPGSVTSIGDNAFSGCHGLTTVTIPGSVTSIGDGAFLFCSGLTTVTIPGSVTSIGNSAFSQCHGLTKVTIPGSITSIGEWAFSFCIGLTTVTIPGSVTSIGYNAFSCCYGLTSVAIPGSVTSIGDSAFSYCYGLTSVTIPGSVTSIGRDAFSGCSALTSVTILGSGTSIGEDAFSGCTIDKAFWLCNTLPQGVSNLSAKVNYVSNNEFSFSCRKVYPFLSSMFEVDNVVYVPVSPSDRTCDVVDYNYAPSSDIVTIADKVNNKGIELTVMNINDYSFSRNSVIQEISLSNRGDVGERAFSDCASLHTATISNQGNIGNEAFSGCASLQTATISSRGNIGERAFLGCASLQTAKISNQGDIGNEAFSDCASLHTATISNQGNIGERAFSDCASLHTATISNRGNIGERAFSDCASLHTATISNQGNIGNEAFKDASKLSELTLGEMVVGIGVSAFSGCGALAEVIIPNSVTSLGENAFYDCSALSHVSIGTGVQSLPQGLFNGCSSLSEISIPGNVSSVAGNVFKGCSSLCDVTIEDGSTKLSLGCNDFDPLFSDCPLDEVYIGRKLGRELIYSSSLGFLPCPSPFCLNTSLRAVRITNAETEIYGSEFYGCTGLQSVEIGDGVTTIGGWAFSGCSAMQTFSCGSKLMTIGEEAFSDCTGLKSFKSKAVNPPACGNQALDDINKWECTLHVPAERETMYQAAPQWKEFFFVKGDASVPVTAISLQHIAEMKVGEQQLIRATVTPDDATDTTIGWSSSDESVATVDFNGSVTAIAPGTVTITATAADGSGVTASCEITVIDASVPVTAISLQHIAEMKVGEQQLIRATVTPDDATDTTIGWRSSDESVATVDFNGFVTAIAPGTVTITATAADGSGVTASCEITVIDASVPVTAISLQHIAEMKVGEQQMIRATVTPDDATDATIGWSSSDESVATVDFTGSVTAIAPGTVTITATAADGSGVTASCEITVIEASVPVTAISLQHIAEMKVGEQQLIRATVTPDDATDATIGWSSSDESVATVDFNGSVTAIAPGTVTITATAADGSGVTASCEITVIDPSGISDVETAEAVVRVIGGEIIVESAPVGTEVRIFAIDGTELYRSVSVGEAIVFVPGVRGVCLVTVGNRCVRISI